MATEAVQGFSQSARAQGLLVKKRCDASKHRVANVASISRTNRIRGQKMPDVQTTNTVRSLLTRFWTYNAICTWDFWGWGKKLVRSYKSGA